MTGGAVLTGPNSLNYNDNTDYDVGTNAGAAISPCIDIGTLQSPVCAFWCNFETEDDGETYDQRHVRVGYLDSNGNPVYFLETQLSTIPGSADAGPCDPMGQWHQHKVALDPAWGAIQVPFTFDTIDNFLNTFAGHFIDDFEVTADLPGPGGGTVGGSVQKDSEGANGDQDWWNTICSGTSTQPGPGAPMLAVLALLALAAVRRLFGNRQ